MDVRERLTVAFYCTTALPIIVAVTSVAVSADAMSQQTASVLVAAGGVTVFLMPLLASVTAHSVNAELGGALREESASSPAPWPASWPSTAAASANGTAS